MGGNYGLFFEMGCLARDAVVKVNNGGCSRQYTIEELYRLWNRTELTKNQRGIPHTTKVRAWMGDRVGLHKIKRVVRSGEKMVYALTVAGHPRLKLTYNHEVLTKRGWVKAGHLTKDDMVACDRLTKHQKKATKTPRKKPRYPCVQVGLYHPYAHETTGYKGKKIRRVEKHRAIFEAHINGLTLAEFQKKTYTTSRKRLHFVNPKEFHIHHKDHNPKNNDVSNLERLRAKDHLKLHNMGYTAFGHGELSWGRVLDFRKVGMEMTYDIVCADPYRNFIANGLVVHNSGKTKTAIDILRNLYHSYRTVIPTLILCPPVVIQNWARELGVHTRIPSNRIYPLFGTGKKRLKTFKEMLDKEPWSVAITNYEALMMKDLGDEILRWMGEHRSAMVCDESHKLKSPEAKRTKRAIDLAMRASHRLLLTGTPILNDGRDLFTQMLILNRGQSFGNNFFAFRNRYFYDENYRMPKDKHFPKWVPIPELYPTMQEKIRPWTMSVKKEECLDLPPLVRQTLEVELAPDQKRIYEDMKKDFVAFIEDKACTADLAIVKALRLMQIVSGFVTAEGEDGREVVKLKKDPRADALRDLLSDLCPTRKVIIWAVWKENYRTIADICDELGFAHVQVHGEVSAKDKAKAVDTFNTDPDCRVYLGHPGSGGIGVNLVNPECDYQVFYSRNFSLEADLQAEARNHRGGSEIHDKITRIDIVTPGTIDAEVMERLAKKQAISGKIIFEVAKNL